MGTTSDKLTYLNTTKTKIKDAINLANTSITNETFRLYEEKIKQAIINTMLDKWKVWDNFDKVTGSGTGLTLNNTHKAPLKLDLNENTYQYSTSGKNLFDLFGITPLVNKISYQRSNNSITQTNMGSYCRSMWEINDLIIGQNYTISCNFTNTSQCSLRLTINDSTNNTLIKQTDTTTLTTGTLSLTFEATETSCYIRIYSNTTDTANSYSVIFSNIQLEKGSTATEYEPYTNGASPNPDYPQDIHLISGDNYLTICAKNLFDKSKATTNYRIGPDGEPLSAFGYSLSSFIKVLPNTTYVRNLGITTNNAVALYDSNKTFISRLTSGTSFTTTNETYYVRTSIITTSLDDLQLEVGNQSSIYEAYQENKYPLYLGVKNLFDKSDIETGKYYKTSEIDTSSNWAISQVKVQPNTNYYLSGNNYNNNTAKIVLLDSSKNILSSVGGYHDTHLITTSSTTAYIGLSISMYEGVDDLNTIQLEKGSKANSYSEYGKEPIEYCGIGDNKNKFIRTSGKNLFDKDNANIINANLADGGTLSQTDNARTLYIPCKPSTTYTISKLQAVYFRVAEFTNTPSIGDSYINRTKNDSANYITFTTTTGNYLAVTYWYSSSTNTEQQVLDSIQIEQNNQATEYNPFGSNEWYLKNVIGKFVLDGSDTSVNYLNGVLYSNDFGISFIATNIYSNYFSYGGTASNTSGAYNKGNNLIVLNNNDNKSIYLRNDNLTSKNDWNSWLSTHNTEIYYVLATPTYTKITDYTLLSQLEAIYNAISIQGVTNILQENNDLPFNIDASAIKEYE